MKADPTSPAGRGDRHSFRVLTSSTLLRAAPAGRPKWVARGWVRVVLYDHQGLAQVVHRRYRIQLPESAGTVTGAIDPIGTLMPVLESLSQRDEVE